MNYETSLKEMYELGVKHGIEIGKRDAELEQLKKEIKELGGEI